MIRDKASVISFILESQLLDCPSVTYQSVRRSNSARSNSARSSARSIPGRIPVNFRFYPGDFRFSFHFLVSSIFCDVSSLFWSFYKTSSFRSFFPRPFSHIPVLGLFCLLHSLHLFFEKMTNLLTLYSLHPVHFAVETYIGIVERWSRGGNLFFRLVNF